MWNKLSLRARITALSAIIFTVMCAILTTLMIINARTAFFATIDDAATIIYSQNSSVTTMPEAVPDSSSQINRLYALQGTAKHDYTVQSIILLVVIVLAGTAIVWFITGSALKPITNLSRTIENIDENNLSENVPIPPADDEVSRLSRSFNSMLNKVGEAYEVQKRFAQNAAHELKTPISSILTNIEVLELNDDTGIDEYRETIAVVKTDTERMSTLVQDLLMLNANDDFNAKCDFREILCEVQSLLAEDIRKKNIIISLEGDAAISGNKALLERAFMNIIQNAVRYNVENGKISVRCSDEKIVISDTGIGIPPDKLDKIFEPFYCVDISRSRSAGGSGLGLAIVKQIFDKYKIRISVDSAVNIGTTITVNLT